MQQGLALAVSQLQLLPGPRRPTRTRPSEQTHGGVGGLTAQVWQAKLAACKTLASCLGKAKSTDKKRRQYNKK